jgi:hypothetical protein
VTGKSVEDEEYWTGVTRRSTRLNHSRKELRLARLSEEFSRQEAVLLDKNMARFRRKTALVQVNFDGCFVDDNKRATVCDDL